MSPIFLYKSCSVATPQHSEPLLLENYVHIVVLAPNLRKVSFYGVIEFLNHISTIELLPFLILYKGVFSEL